LNLDEKSKISQFILKLVQEVNGFHISSFSLSFATRRHKSSLQWQYLFLLYARTRNKVNQ